MLAELSSTRDENLHQVIMRTAIIAAAADDAPLMLTALRSATPVENTPNWRAGSQDSRLPKRRKC